MKTAAVALLFSVSCAVMLSSADAAANVFFIHTDHLDTPRVVSDLAGNKVWIADYDAFGKATITSNTLAPYTSAMNVRFPGQYFDAETSTHYNYFRDYDPLIGRYLQSDPIGLKGGINTYGYVSSNPLRYTDPSGLQSPLAPSIPSVPGLPPLSPVIIPGTPENQASTNAIIELLKDLMKGGMTASWHDDAEDAGEGAAEEIGRSSDCKDCKAVAKQCYDKCIESYQQGKAPVGDWVSVCYAACMRASGCSPFSPR